MHLVFFGKSGVTPTEAHVDVIPNTPSRQHYQLRIQEKMGMNLNFFVVKLNYA
jgi:hypothetical protein